jgi:hypothetical protein
LKLIGALESVVRQYFPGLVELFGAQILKVYEDVELDLAVIFKVAVLIVLAVSPVIANSALSCQALLVRLPVYVAVAPHKPVSAAMP